MDQGRDGRTNRGPAAWRWSRHAARSVDCLTLDVPGCGTKRGRDASAIEFDDIATELIADLDAAGASDVVLVGHSQAGQLIPRMAEFRPGLFRRLNYVTCSASPHGTSILELMGSRRHGESDDCVGYPHAAPGAATFEDNVPIMFGNDMPAGDRAEFLAQLGPEMWPLSSCTHRGLAVCASVAVPVDLHPVRA